MACYVSLNFSFLPFYPSHTELRLNKPTTYALSSARCKRANDMFAAHTIISSSRTSKYATTTQDFHPCCHLKVSCRNPTALVSFPSGKAYCSRTLSGYWVGPDSDDGWGFVQALVDEII